MNCLDSQIWLQRRFDGESVSHPEDLEQHWKECAPCREQHAAALCMIEGLHLIPKPSPAPGFAQALATKVIQDRRHRQGKMRRRVFVTMALAASVLMLLMLGYYWMPSTHPEKPHQPAPSVLLPEVKLPVALSAPEERLSAPSKEPRNAIEALTERWMDTTRDHAKVVLVAANLDEVDKLPALNGLPPLDPGVREAGQEMTDGVRAVTRNAQRAFHFFARELPMPESETPRN